MSGVAIYMEGGGTSRDGKNALRQGMDAFLSELKNAAREKSWNWKLVCCGGRDEAISKFQKARGNGDDTNVVLLVDSEGPVNRSSSAHLNARDGSNLTGADDDAVHLMTEVMETSIVSDPDALNKYYGQGFGRNALPQARDLEMVAKNDVMSALESATGNTQKGKYRKIRHASDLLQRIDPGKAKERCSRCKQLFISLGEVIADG